MADPDGQEYPKASEPHLCFGLNTNSLCECNQSSKFSGVSPSARKPRIKLII